MTALCFFLVCHIPAAHAAGCADFAAASAEACKCSATCKSDVGCWTVAKDTMGALTARENLVCGGIMMAVSPSFLLPVTAAFAAVLAGRGLFQ